MPPGAGWHVVPPGAGETTLSVKLMQELVELMQADDSDAAGEDGVVVAADKDSAPLRRGWSLDC